MKTTKVYVNEDRVVLYGEWPVEPEKITGFETKGGLNVEMGGDFGYEKAMKKYEQALKKAIEEAENTPFEDQKAVKELIFWEWYKSAGDYDSFPGFKPGFYYIQAEVGIEERDTVEDGGGCFVAGSKYVAVIKSISNETPEQIEADANALLIVKLLDVMDRAYHHMKFYPPDKTKMSYNEWQDILQHMEYYRSEYKPKKK